MSVRRAAGACVLALALAMAVGCAGGREDVSTDGQGQAASTGDLGEPAVLAGEDGAETGAAEVDGADDGLTPSYDPVVEDDFPPDSTEAGIEFLSEGGEGEPGQVSDELRNQLVEAAQEDGRVVLSGTCRVLTGAELGQLQDVSAEMVLGDDGSTSRYAVLLFDEPTSVLAMHSGDYGTPYEGEANMVCLAIDEDNEWGHEGDLAEWEEYDGQRVTVSIDPADTLFPSDVRFPLGQPHTGSAELLFVG